MTEHIRPGDARWAELVASGRDAVARVDETKTERNWRLGDAALEIAPMGEDATNNGASAALEQYATEVGVNANSLREYRLMASRWEPATRVAGAGWKVHQILALPERQHLVVAGMTVTEAHAAAGQSTAGRSGPRADAADRARAAADALADPAVREEYERIAENRPQPEPQPEPSPAPEPEPVPHELSARAREITRMARESAQERDAERTQRDNSPAGSYSRFVTELGVATSRLKLAVHLYQIHAEDWQPAQRADAAELMDLHRAGAVLDVDWDAALADMTDQG